MGGAAHSGREVGQAASLPAAPAGAKFVAEAVASGGRLAACPTWAGARRRLRTWTAWLLGLTAGAGLAAAQGTAFSYQGQLTDGAAAANGTYDLNFTLWNAATGGDQQGTTLTQAGVGVTNGLFTATLDFGAQFSGPNRWLEIAVRTNGAADFTTLAERQPVLPTPYAIHAATAGNATTATTASTVTGPIPATQLIGSLSAVQIPNLDASKITSGTFTGIGSGLGRIPVSSLVQSDYSVAAWGDNRFHQTDVPAGLMDVVAIAAGFSHSVALKADGTVVAWGDTTFGKTTVPVGLTGVAAVSAGGYHSLALKAGPASPATLARLDQDNVFRGAVSALEFSGSGSDLTSLNASALSSGTVPVAQIPNLDASKVTTGTFATAQIPNLDAAKITTGTLDDARLSANVALENGSPAFTAAAGAQVASFTGTRTGNHNTPLVLVENKDTTASSIPALRVIGRGGAHEGALSVSAVSGPIAQFGNELNWVATIENNGSLTLSGTLSQASDRNVKAGFAPVDVDAVLAKVAGLPLTTWHYTNDAAATPHLGPMAQDFHAAFGLGGDDKTITTVEADGVALAAIQGLHRRTETLAAENAAIREELARQQSANADLRGELGDLRSLVLQLQQQLNANRP